MSREYHPCFNSVLPQSGVNLDDSVHVVDIAEDDDVVLVGILFSQLLVHLVDSHFFGDLLASVDDAVGSEGFPDQFSGVH